MPLNIAMGASHSSCPCPLHTRPARRAAFTLVELLVVVVIIALLLSLLTPALDKAIYQAELTQCSANQSGAAAALNVYAASFRRSYPSRPNCGVYAMATYQLTGAGVSVNDTLNIRGWLPLNKSFNDPFCKKIDVEKSAGTSASAPSGVFAPYSYYAGAHFSHKNVAGTHQKGMKKLGDRFAWDLTQADAPYPGGPRTYDLLFGDWAYTATARNAGRGSHPDKKGVWYPQWGQDIGNYNNASAPAGAYQNTITETLWWGGVRGPIDLNFTHADASVQRVVDVEYADDDRMDWIPQLWDNQYGWDCQIPSH